MIKLIATDIDGTLLNSHGQVPQEHRIALAAAQALGVLVVMATARKRDSTMRIADQLGIPYAMICQSGAVLYDQEHAPISEIAIDLDLAHAVATVADEHGYGLVTTIREQNYHVPDLNLSQNAEGWGNLVASNRDALVSAPTRLLALGEQASLLLIERFQHTPLRFNRHYQNGILHDTVITAASATKESALATLCQRWQIAPTDVLALGDAEADIGMLQLAGVGVAMGNAQPEVRSAANWVAPSNDQAGVAAAIRRFVLQEN
jgi:Cof subfamily protein (haloacid dehalogenase superfamily)